jgi:hypothetical protein
LGSLPCRLAKYWNDVKQSNNGYAYENSPPNEIETFHNPVCFTGHLGPCGLLPPIRVCANAAPNL